MSLTIWAIGTMFTYGFILSQEKEDIDRIRGESSLKYVFVMFRCLVSVVAGWPMILGGYVSDYVKRKEV